MWQTPSIPRLKKADVRQTHRVHIDEEYAARALAFSLHNHLAQVSTPGTPPVLVCVGTDRSTGDALGPLIGTSLIKSLTALPIYGTLENPVHAVNLSSTLAIIEAEQPNQPIVAIDACLGQLESVGYVSVKQGALRPGSGVNKNLPAIGHLHMIGVVNVGGFMEYLVLQNTRLSLVMRMATVIAEAIEICLVQKWLAAGKRGNSRTADMS